MPFNDAVRERDNSKKCGAALRTTGVPQAGSR
jgi:hypothetical protein